MKLISHRGNLIGSNPELENNPEYIIQAIENGFDVEIDLWYQNSKFYLGHDNPQYEIEIEWILNLKDKLWVHCKNTDCIDKIYGMDINYFWHDKDLTTITNKGFLWSLPNVFLKNGITVCNEFVEIPEVFGVCTDNPIKFRQKNKE